MTRSELFSRIRKGSLNFSRKNMSLANFVVGNYQKVAFMTARELAQACGVSESTVMRFVISLDFRGYPDFLRALQEIVNQELTAVERLEITGEEKGRRGKKRREERLSRRTILTEIENLRRLYDGFSDEDFDRAIDEIFQAKQIVILGFRVSAALATYFGYILQKVKEPVAVLTKGDSTAYERLGRLGRESLIIALGFRRYPRELMDALEFCKNRGLKILALSDSVVSPVAALADLILVVDLQSESFVDTFAAPICLINGLISETAMRDKRKSLGMLNRLEGIAEERGIYFQERG